MLLSVVNRQSKNKYQERNSAVFADFAPVFGSFFSISVSRHDAFFRAKTFINRGVKPIFGALRIAYF